MPTGTPGFEPSFPRGQLEELGRRLGVSLIVLFGSRATGRPAPGPRSDVDIAVRVGAPGARERFLEIHAALADRFAGAPLDLVLLDDADPLLRWEVMRAGVRLHGELDDFLEYRAYAYRDFVDSADLRALEAALHRKKLAWLDRRIHGAA